MSSDKLFDFGRKLPYPFDSMANKKVDVQSMYGEKNKATLFAGMIKAARAYCTCKDGSNKGAIGIIDHRSVCEYKSSTADECHLAVYDSDRGTVVASVYNENTEIIENYTLHSTGRDGAAIITAMIPVLIKDQEFRDTLDLYYEEHKNSFPNLDQAKTLMGILCDNVYRRVKDPQNPAHVAFDCDAAGNLTRINKAQIDNSMFEPKSVLVGEFTILAHVGGNATIISPSAPIMENDSFSGKFKLNASRTLTAIEHGLIPVLEPWYILPEQVVSVCRHAQSTTGHAAPMRNFMFRGPAGTGKTEGAKAVAAGLGLPYLKYTCNAGSEIFDFCGQPFPDSMKGSTGDPDLDRERQELMEMGGINYENVAKLMNLPSLDDLDYFPEGVYQAITGVSNQEATTQECLSLIMNMVSDKIQKLCNVRTDEQKTGQTYSYVETDFIKALKHGYVVEVQEPATIIQAGVLVGLNSLLEQGGSITLPTGEIIRRHPDTVVILTTNVSYEGNRRINQSVTDRMSLVYDISHPSKEVMVQRAMSVTGCRDDLLVSQMVEVVTGISDYCRENGISDGNCGMRSLIDWINSTTITGKPYDSALCTIISKATADEADQESLKTSVLELKFKPESLYTAA